MTEWSDDRRLYCQPIIVALIGAGIAEAFYLVVFGAFLFPEGNFAAKVMWTTTCAIAIGATIGALTVLSVAGRLSRRSAIVASAVIAIAVSVACTGVCLIVDQSFDFFGGVSQPGLFAFSGVVPALLIGPLYGWLLYSDEGQEMLQSAGL